MNFELVSNFCPAGDQPKAIRSLVEGIEQGLSYQTLLGVTGSGKTFTMANVVAQIGRPALILSHNKTLAAQLFKEFKEFFPNNAIEYFISYYDFYQPEAYLPASNTYIEKDFGINSEIERMRLAATSALLSGRQDIVIVSSVSCLYGMGNPENYKENVVSIRRGMAIAQTIFLHKLVAGMYSRNQDNFTNGHFRVIGDTVDVFLAYSDMALRVIFWGDEIDEICTFNPVNGQVLKIFERYDIYPAGLFTVTQKCIDTAVQQIEIDLDEHVCFLNGLGKIQEARRLSERVKFDMEMIKQLGYCSGIENYSRYFDGRKPGERPFCLIDFFPKNFLMIIDESHVTIPQVQAMYGGDRARKINLVEYGFRLPAAVDNRPLTFDEFESITPQKIFISATPAEYELQMCEGVIIEQVVRPTGLLDPIIEIRSTLHQIDDLMEEIKHRMEQNERTLITTLTKRMAEELSSYFVNLDIQTVYIHSDVDALERVEIIDKFRQGIFDVLIGVNLLREGLDLPEVSLVAILDADKEGFLRSYRSLTQTAGRAARNINGKVIFYADKITKSMQRTVDDTNKRREKQLLHNKKNKIIPKQIQKATLISLIRKTKPNNPIFNAVKTFKEVQTMNYTQLKETITQTRKMMLFASRQFEYLEAARYRDELLKLENLVKNRFPDRK